LSYCRLRLDLVHAVKYTKKLWFFQAGILRRNFGVWGGKPKYTLENRPFFIYYIKVMVFKYTRFSSFASKEGITDHELLEIVKEL
jgi:hypothetical protein